MNTTILVVALLVTFIDLVLMISHQIDKFRKAKYNHQAPYYVNKRIQYNASKNISQIQMQEPAPYSAIINPNQFMVTPN